MAPRLCIENQYAVQVTSERHEHNSEIARLTAFRRVCHFIPYNKSGYVGPYANKLNLLVDDGDTYMGSTRLCLLLRLLKSQFICILHGLLVFGFGNCVFGGQSRPGSGPAPSLITGSVEGHVLCSDGGFPARNARVHLIPLSRFSPDAAKRNIATRSPEDSWTDLDGNYLVGSVQPGAYIVNVEKEGYMTYGAYILGVLDRYSQDQQKALLGMLPQVTVVNGGASRADVTLHRGGAIMGRINFDGGGPLSKAIITATLVSSQITARENNAQGPDLQNYRPTLTTTTDDRGFYRFAGLLPGKYLIDAEVREGLFHNDSAESTVGRLWVYAPDALTETDARVMEVGEGDEISDADVTIPTRRLHAISGLITQSGAPLAEAHVSVHRKEENEARFAYNAISASDGSYRIDLLPPGTYAVNVEYYPEKGSLRHVAKETTVQLMGGDVADANVDLPLQPAVK